MILIEFSCSNALYCTRYYLLNIGVKIVVQRTVLEQLCYIFDVGTMSYTSFICQKPKEKNVLSFVVCTHSCCAHSFPEDSSSDDKSRKAFLATTCMVRSKDCWIKQASNISMLMHVDLDYVC